MAKASEKVEEQPKLPPIKPTDFGLVEHKVRRFTATVIPAYKDYLEDPAIWASVAPQMRICDEVRIVAEDMTFVAYAIVTFAQGSMVRLKVLDIYELDEVEDTEDEGDDFELKLCGSKRWCIRLKSTGEIQKEGFATQLIAMKELADLRKALSR